MRSVPPMDQYLVAADRQAKAHQHGIEISAPQMAEHGAQANQPRPSGGGIYFHDSFLARYAGGV